MLDQEHHVPQPKQLYNKMIFHQLYLLQIKAIWWDKEFRISYKKKFKYKIIFTFQIIFTIMINGELIFVLAQIVPILRPVS